jgi:hypothetical protein
VKKILTYAQNNKGVTLVMMALMLAVLIMLASLAIDIAYMYFAKNQLQVAADAAALAGAANLDRANVTSLDQQDARQQAWKFACQNKAVGSPVFLVTNIDIGGGSDCDSPPLASNLNSANSDNDDDNDGINDDIVVGNWNFQTRQFSTVDISLTKPVNAVKVRARRTKEGEAYGMPEVGLFLGKIFQLIGADWSVMAVKASAIAAMPPKASGFVAMGCGACDNPITVNSDCIGPENPYPCCTGTGTSTCRVLFTTGGGSECPSSCIGSSSCTSSSCIGCYKYFAWTGLSENLSSSTFDDNVCTESPYDEICGASCTPSGQIYGLSGGSTGAALADFAAAMYDPRLDTSNKDINLLGDVDGWWMMMPWTAGANPLAGSPDCGGSGGGAYSVKGYVKTHIIAVCSGPGASSGCSGFPPNGYPTSTPPFCASLPSSMQHAIVIDSIECIPCGDFQDFGLKPSLVS